MSDGPSMLPEWITARRATDLAQHWDYAIRSFRASDGVFMCETVHRGEFSRDMELRAIKAVGRRGEVVDLRPWRAGVATP